MITLSSFEKNHQQFQRDSLEPDNCHR